MAQIKCENLAIGYEDVTLFRDFSLEINKGDYVFVLGHNGAGKTTLMKTLLGLKKPLAGTITFDESVTGIGYLPQQKEMQKDFPASVMEVICSGCKGSRKEIKETAAQMAGKLGISDLMGKSFARLSGGQQQKVLLARSLCAASGLLVLDEPITGLDPVAMKEFYILIKKLNIDEELTIVMISHDPEAAARYATHILLVSDKPKFITAEEYEAMAGKVG